MKESKIQFASPYLEKFRTVDLQENVTYDIIVKGEEEDMFHDFQESELKSHFFFGIIFTKFCFSQLNLVARL